VCIEREREREREREEAWPSNIGREKKRELYRILRKLRRKWKLERKSSRLIEIKCVKH
jgi:hypothetical protein